MARTLPGRRPPEHPGFTAAGPCHRCHGLRQPGSAPSPDHWPPPSAVRTRIRGRSPRRAARSAPTCRWRPARRSRRRRCAGCCRHPTIGWRTPAILVPKETCSDLRFLPASGPQVVPEGAAAHRSVWCAVRRRKALRPGISPRPKRLPALSGRQDLNLRPLDPQSSRRQPFSGQSVLTDPVPREERPGRSGARTPCGPQVVPKKPACGAVGATSPACIHLRGFHKWPLQLGSGIPVSTDRCRWLLSRCRRFLCPLGRSVGTGDGRGPSGARRGAGQGTGFGLTRTGLGG